MASVEDGSVPAVVVPTSRGVYVSGINKRVTRSILLAHFSPAGAIESCDFSEEPRKGFAWIRYETQAAADVAVRSLHHSELLGTVIVVRHELGLNAAGARVAALGRGTASCPPKSIAVLESAYGKSTRAAVPVTYGGRGLLVGNVEYPIPTGTYLMRLLLQCHSSVLPRKQALVDALLDAHFGNRHAKELSESMAIVNAIPVCGHRTGVDLSRVEGVQVYVLGDGVLPFTAIVMLLFAPPSWRFTSIDPLMSFDPAALGPGYADRVACVAALSQDFVLPGEPARGDAAVPASLAGHTATPVLSPTLEADGGDAATGHRTSGDGVRETTPLPPTLSIVVACHSHAPLQDFWDRLAGPKIAVSLPCCGKTWSLLTEPPLHEYEDYEVFSPKRRVYIYARGVGT